MNAFEQKQKFLIFVAKTPYLGIFRRQFWKFTAIFEITALEFVKFQSFIQNRNNVKLGFEKVFLGKFRREFEKKISIFEISTFEFVKMQSVTLKEKNKCRDRKCLIWVFLH